jgi:hypothetical protein
MESDMKNLPEEGVEQPSLKAVAAAEGGQLAVAPTGRVLPDLRLEQLGASIKELVRAYDESVMAQDVVLAKIGHKLIEARELADKQGKLWDDYLAEHCDLRRSRANELIRIAKGEVTGQALRERNAHRNRAHRERKRSAPSSPSRDGGAKRSSSTRATESPVPAALVEPDGNPDQPSRVVRALAAFDALDALERAEFLARRGLREIDDGIPVSLRRVA